MDVHITVDFFDDIFSAKSRWSEQKLRQLVCELAARNIKAIHWIGHGRMDGGCWDQGSYFDVGRSDGASIAEQIPEPLELICKEAHRLGMKVYDVLKPCDMVLSAPYSSFPVGKEPIPPIGLPYVGGTGNCAARWIREHPDKRVRLHPSLTKRDSGKPIRTLRLWHDRAAIDAKPEISLMVSDDNGTYRLYEGPCTTTYGTRRRRPPIYAPAPEKVWGEEEALFCLELADMEISQPFLAVCLGKPSGLANTLTAFCEVEDDAGDPVACTYGFTPIQPYGERGRDWRTTGIAFDTTRGLGVNRLFLRSAVRERFELDKLEVLGIARGRNTYPAGVV
ncbi:MAG: hypothetical protein KAJ01_09955, partial [Candidatus Hydrogenedentes bacterium]|nr:hypothetical protein [Candidatus Hydrogenedentota bacterium]